LCGLLFGLKTDRQVKSNPMPQLELPIPRRPRHSGADVSDEVIDEMPTMLAAIDLAQKVAGLDDQQVCAALQIDPGQWSRVKSSQANFPTNKYVEFMNVCGNEIPLRWLAIRRGYELRRLLSSVEEELQRTKAELAEEKAKNETITRFVRETRR
jgi:hypothetical protein